MNCTLCNSQITEYKTGSDKKQYLLCSNCKLIQLDKDFHLSKIKEKERYLLHENSRENKGYINYLNNIIENSLTPYLKPGNRILDFGCGPEKTWADILKRRGYKISTYDPFFDQNSNWKNSKYDAITSIEVFEHLLSPVKEFETLNSCMKKGSFLIIRTMLHNNNWKNFQKWWYRDDKTHISFYSETTINYICNRWNYKLMQIYDNCEIVLKKL